MRLSLFPTLVTTLLLVASAAPAAHAQGVQDLFRRPQPQETDTNDSELDGLFRAPAAEVKTARNEDPRIASPSDRQLMDEHGSMIPARQSMAMELRQARALEAYRQRQARLEVANWSGNHTLRPSWSPTPSTSSRYPTHQTLYVPMYIRR